MLVLEDDVSFTLDTSNNDFLRLFFLGIGVARTVFPFGVFTLLLTTPMLTCFLFFLVSTFIFLFPQSFLDRRLDLFGRKMVK